MDFATYQSAEAKYHISGGEVYRVSHLPQSPSAARTYVEDTGHQASAKNAPLYGSPLPSAFLNVMTPSSDMGHHRLVGEHQLEVNQGIRNTLNALRSTLGSQGAAIRGADHAVKSQQSDLTQLCLGLADVQAATAATSTELAALRDATAAADEAALAQVRPNPNPNPDHEPRPRTLTMAQVNRLHEGAEQQSRRRTAEATRRLEALALGLAAAEERAYPNPDPEPDPKPNPSPHPIPHSHPNPRSARWPRRGRSSGGWSR